MKFQETKIKGVWILEWEPRGDERGYFGRNFAKEEFAARGIDFGIVHVNRSWNKEKGTTRGLHYQLPPKAEDKLLQCLRGGFYDVVLDLRKNSPTYGKWVSVELAPEKKNIVFVPKGCANGVQVLENDSELQYFVSEYYSPEHERGVRFDDPYFAIDWPFKKPAVISPKDAAWPLAGENNKPLVEL